MKKILLHSILVALGISAMSCSDSEPEQNPDGVQETEVSSIFVGSSKIRAADGIEGEGTSDTDPIIISNFSNGDLLYFSQMPQGYSPNFSDYTQEALSYLYVYRYNGNENATWSQGENFSVSGDRLSFNWDRVMAVGPSGNSFKFFAFHYPVQNVVRWNVETDQTGGDGNEYDTSNFMKSDIMGAYHATSSLFTRMRFRLFHLMTYLKITLYVPVYDGNFSDPEKQEYSGFDEGALMGGYMLNAITDFNIEWAAAKSSDTEAPLVQTDASSRRSNLKMYRHPDHEDEISQINVRKFYSQHVDGIEGDYDNVRTYNFSVIFPNQTFDSDMLCFALKTPGGDTKYYYFSNNQTLLSDEQRFELTQGTLQQLYLYLPRKTNQSIIVGAKILPWEDTVTDMTVNKQQTND